MIDVSSSWCFKRRVVRSSKSQAIGSSQLFDISQVWRDIATSNDMWISDPPGPPSIRIDICTRTGATLAKGSPTSSSDAVRACGSEATIRPLPWYSGLKGPIGIAIRASNEPGPVSLVRVAPGTQSSSVSGS